MRIDKLQLLYIETEHKFGQRKQNLFKRLSSYFQHDSGCVTWTSIFNLRHSFFHILDQCYDFVVEDFVANNNLICRYRCDLKHLVAIFHSRMSAWSRRGRLENQIVA